MNTAPYNLCKNRSASHLEGRYVFSSGLFLFGNLSLYAALLALGTLLGIEQKLEILRGVNEVGSRISFNVGANVFRPSHQTWISYRMNHPVLAFRIFKCLYLSAD
jgi:hypothetical protein